MARFLNISTLFSYSPSDINFLSFKDFLNGFESKKTKRYFS